MRTTMDAAGRLVIPARIRREAGFRAGVELEVNVRDGGIVIEPAPLQVHLEQRGRFLVAVPDDEDARPLTNDVVEETRKKVVDDRSQL